MRGPFTAMAGLTTDQKGRIAECYAEARAIELGYEVSRPVKPERYDLVLLRAGNVCRVQVKYADGTPSPANGSSGCTVVSLRTVEVRRGGAKSRPYSADDIDAVVAYLPALRELLWLPAGLVAGRGYVNVRHVRPKNGWAGGYHWWEDYVWTDSHPGRPAMRGAAKT